MAEQAMVDDIDTRKPFIGRPRGTGRDKYEMKKTCAVMIYLMLVVMRHESHLNISG